MSDAVLLSVEGHVATLTLNRPEQKNTMSVALLDGFAARVAEVKRDADVRACVITGSGAAFCAGADFQAVAALAARLGDDGADRARTLRALYDAFLLVETLEVPTVAAINGHAVGGGLGLALACDIRVVAPNAKLGANFARLGIAPGMLIDKRLVALLGQERAKLLLYSGALVRGREAAAMGLCLEACDDPLARAHALAAQFAAAAPLAVRHIKALLRRIDSMSDEEILDDEARAQARLSQTSDAAEGIGAMMARREPRFTGS